MVSAVSMLGCEVSVLMSSAYESSCTFGGGKGMSEV